MADQHLQGSKASALPPLPAWDAKPKFGQRCVSCGHRVFRWHTPRVFGLQWAPVTHHRCWRGAVYAWWLAYDRKKTLDERT